jgi:hypothetical protein
MVWIGEVLRNSDGEKHRLNRLNRLNRLKWQSSSPPHAWGGGAARSAVTEGAAGLVKVVHDSPD